MPIVVIGGHSRKVGKTSVVAGLISALPERRWTALKISQDEYGICSAKGGACDCATDDHSWAILEERNCSGKSDTSRFLVAGAVHSWWVRTEPGHFADAMPRIRQILARAENAIIESNSILRFLKPDLYLAVLDPQTADFKASAREFLGLADAVLMHEAADSVNQSGKQISPKLAADRPIFAIRPPQYVTPEIVEFVRNRLSKA